MKRQELIKQIFGKNTFLCVGLDPVLEKLPACVHKEASPIFAFNKAIIDATAPYCVAYKPNLAFYEAYGLKGLEAFEQTVGYLQNNYPDHFLIADAKRGDIGNTSSMYAKTFFDNYNVDALTVAPYMGEDSVKPFLEDKNKWVVLLALTSNKGSMDFQFCKDENGMPLYEKVMRKSMEWANDNQLMFVVGATQGSLFKDIRTIAPNHFLLVPGVGAQGGSLQEVCRYGMTNECGLLVNSSRGIIFADNSTEFAHEAARKAQKIQQEMAQELRAVL